MATASFTRDAVENYNQTTPQACKHDGFHILRLVRDAGSNSILRKRFA